MEKRRQRPAPSVIDIADPDHARIELPGQEPTPVTPYQLDEAEREQAWQHISKVQPRYAKYQNKSERLYPVIRLTSR